MSGFWMPGQAKPSADKEQQPRQQHGDGSKSLRPEAKKLSGTTMNMRFMQRNASKKESTREQEEDCMDTSHMEQDSSPVKDNNTPQQVHQIDETGNSDWYNLHQELEEESAPFGTATPTDMYGVEANLLGRRSFGGFHPPMARAWQECRLAIHKNNDNSSKGRKRRTSPIGNLDQKLKKKKRRRKSRS